MSVFIAHPQQGGRLFGSGDDTVMLDPAYKPKRARGMDTSNADCPDFQSLPLSLDFDMKEDHFSKILVIYTGGTIGMKNVDGGKNKSYISYTVKPVYKDRSRDKANAVFIDR